jgi:hypothetical protein
MANSPLAIIIGYVKVISNGRSLVQRVNTLVGYRCLGLLTLSKVLIDVSTAVFQAVTNEVSFVFERRAYLMRYSK